MFIEEGTSVTLAAEVTFDGHVVPVPISPEEFPPQHFTAPDSDIPQAWSPCESIISISLRPTT
jgi:hypothetical protein